MNIHNAPTTPQTLATLWFGANIPDGREVWTEDWESFLADSVTPHFPGFTVTSGDGYWKGKPEFVRVLTLLSDDSDGFRNQVRMIAEHYKTRFEQEAVAYAFQPVQYTMDVWPHGPVAAYHKPGLGY